MEHQASDGRGAVGYLLCEYTGTLPLAACGCGSTKIYVTDGGWCAEARSRGWGGVPLSTEEGSEFPELGGEGGGQ